MDRISGPLASGFLIGSANARQQGESGVRVFLLPAPHIRSQYAVYVSLVRATVLSAGFLWSCHPVFQQFRTLLGFSGPTGCNKFLLLLALGGTALPLLFLSSAHCCINLFF